MKTINFKSQSHIKRKSLAALIDYSIIMALCFLTISILGTLDENGTYHLSGWPVLILNFIWLLFTVMLETFFGSTLGNAVAGLKPVPLNKPNSKITFGQSFLRHIVDPIDMFPLGLIGIMIITNSRFKQRLGDILANTVVVRNA